MDTGMSRLSYVSETVSPDKESRIEYEGVVLDIPAGAVKEETGIRIIKLPETVSLEEGMSNATTGAKGYRFELSGIHFEKNVKVSIPFDEKLLESETAISNLFTYFYDEEVKTWERLPRLEVDRERKVVVSLTDHFTDMITATLKMPESPENIDFNINSIKNLEAANPDSGVVKLEGPEAGPQGSAAFRIPLDISRGRGNMVPELSLSYNSGSANSWMGKGFDISVSSITTDTRFGLPEYNGYDTCLFEGEELILTDSFGDSKKYRMRVEKGFWEILLTTDTTGDIWRVTDKDGVVRVYGQGEGWIGPVRTDRTRVYTWYLSKEIDANGNTVTYTYDHDAENNCTYLKEIRYTGWTDGNTEEEGKYLISFITSEGRPDRRIDGRGKFVSKLVRRLDELDVSYNGEVFRKYTFSYHQNEFGQTELEDFTESNENGESFIPTLLSTKNFP